jgi:hypothetical protein
MNTPVTILRVQYEKDADGFATPTDQPVKSVRAYFEQRHGNVKWANRAAFSEATALFRFRVIPGDISMRGGPLRGAFRGAAAGNVCGSFSEGGGRRWR